MIVEFMTYCGMLMLFLLYTLSRTKRDKRLVASYGPAKWREKNTPFFRFMLWAFDGVGDQIRLFRISRRIVFVLIGLFLVSFILALSFGWYKIQGFTKYYILSIFILDGMVLATNNILICTQQICAGAMKKDVDRFKRFFRNLDKKKQSGWVHFGSTKNLSKAVKLTDSLEKYCYTKEKGIYYILEKDLDRIRTSELKKYKYACEKTEYDAKGQEYFVVYDQYHHREIFRVPIK